MSDYGSGDDFYDDEITSGPIVEDEMDYDPLPDLVDAGFYEIDDGYCDWCEVSGHMFRNCPRRDDN